MPSSCAAWGCSNRRSVENTSKGITFHSFPKQPKERRLWEAALRREAFTATQSSKICSEHFRQEDLDKTGQTVRIRDGAVPSVFKFPDPAQRPPAARKSIAPKKSKKKRSKNSQESMSVDSPLLVPKTEHLPANTPVAAKTRGTPKKKNIKQLTKVQERPSVECPLSKHEPELLPVPHIPGATGTSGTSKNNDKEQSEKAPESLSVDRVLFAAKEEPSHGSLARQVATRTNRPSKRNRKILKANYWLPVHNAPVATRTSRTSQKARESLTVDKSTPVPKTEPLPDHQYSLPSSPDLLKAKLKDALARVASLEKENRNATVRERRAKHAVYGLLRDLKGKKVMIEELKERLDSYSELPVHLLSRHGHEYTEEQKEFALTLYLHGSKVYSYLRESLHFYLPHPHTLQRWMSLEPDIRTTISDVFKRRQEKDLAENGCAMADQEDDAIFFKGHAFLGHTLSHHSQMDVERIYMDYNATTPLAPEVIGAVSTALQDAWGNPSCSYREGVRAKEIISQSRENVARMVGGKAEDIIFTSGGTEANNLVFHTALEHFRKSSQDAAQCKEGTTYNGTAALPHIIISNVEHDSVRLTAQHLQKEGRADLTLVPVSKTTGQVEVEDVISAVRPTTCLISIMLANNETAVLMPVREICQRIKSFTKQHRRPRILLHTDAAQALGKVRVDVCDLEVDYLTIVGHKFYAPRIGALYVNGPGSKTPLYPMLFGGGQERNFRPGTENTPMIAGLGKAAELVSSNLSEYQSHMQDIRLYLEERLRAIFGEEKIRFNSHFPGTDTLPNTCNVSILGPRLQGRKVLSNCTRLLASVGAACHSQSGDRPSHILLSCGIPPEVAVNALRLSVGRDTSLSDVDLVVEDLRDTVELLESTN